MIKVDTTNAIKVIDDTFNAKERQAFKIMQYYAAQIMIYMSQVQASAPKESRGKFWTNHTFKMISSYLATPFIRNESNEIGISIINRVWYAKFIEYGHELRFASFPTILEKFAPLVYADMKTIFKGV